MIKFTAYSSASKSLIVELVLVKKVSKNFSWTSKLLMKTKTSIKEEQVLAYQYARKSLRKWADKSKLIAFWEKVQRLKSL